MKSENLTSEEVNEMGIKDLYKKIDPLRMRPRSNEIKKIG